MHTQVPLFTVYWLVPIPTPNNEKIEGNRDRRVRGKREECQIMTAIGVPPQKSTGAEWSSFCLIGCPPRRNCPLKIILIDHDRARRLRYDTDRVEKRSLKARNVPNEFKASHGSGRVDDEHILDPCS